MMARDEIKIESAFRHANMVIESYHQLLLRSFGARKKERIKDRPMRNFSSTIE